MCLDLLVTMGRRPWSLPVYPDCFWSIFLQYGFAQLGYKVVHLSLIIGYNYLRDRSGKYHNITFTELVTFTELITFIELW